MSAANPAKEQTVVVTAHDLPLHCPPRAAPLWSQHPRVFLDIAPTGEILCPYCSTHYVLEGGPAKSGH
ncbi:MAG: zinc-finger domain-containing protein [Burkholderiales bacterium]|nr:zinc-finger domain-containing protein [Betaproteobacteria bacterium]MBP8295292.1 zinc-finger domain-containing protein [Burkholderiales bacterium]